MSFGFKFDPNLPAKVRAAMSRRQTNVVRAVRGAQQDTAALIKERGDANIQRSGTFGGRWLSGFQVTVQRGRIILSHDQKGARLFEYGGQVKGKPFLAIPLSFSNARNIRAKNFPGGLFRVNREGKSPLLLSIRDKKPKYVLLSRVRMPRKWRLRDIADYVIKNNFPKFLANRLKNG